jgi:DNA repair protein RecO (recombination protein O)
MIDKDIGFILKRYPLRDTSLIATIYTLKYGKIRGIFKGFYTLKKEFSSSLDVFTLNEFVFYPRKNELWLVSFSDLILDFPFLRENLSKAKVASLIFNILDKSTDLWVSNPSIFSLLKSCLSYLNQEKELKIFYIFLIKFINFCGFKPNLGECVSCFKNLEEEIYFSPSCGGLVCKNCSLKIKDTQIISKQTTASFSYIQKNDFPFILRLKLNLDTEKEILKILNRFLSYHLELDYLSNFYKF